MIINWLSRAPMVEKWLHKEKKERCRECDEDVGSLFSLRASLAVGSRMLECPPVLWSLTIFMTTSASWGNISCVPVMSLAAV